MNDSRPPPSYNESEFDALIASLSDLDLSRLVSAPSTSPILRPERSIPTSVRPAPTRSDTVHLSPRMPEEPPHSDLTPSRSPAKSPKSPSKGKRAKHARVKHAAYAVFRGAKAGVYEQWFGPAGAEAQVRGVPYSLHQGYATVSQAQAAFEYARQRSWTSPLDASAPSIMCLPTPQASDAVTPNPLHGGIFVPRWHIVYAGITPGIYASYLECALNTLGLSNALYDSTSTREEAEVRWQEATRTGKIRVLSHSYPLEL